MADEKNPFKDVKNVASLNKGLALQRAWTSKFKDHPYQAVPSEDTAFFEYYKDMFEKDASHSKYIWKEDPTESFPGFPMDETTKRQFIATTSSDPENTKLKRILNSPPFWWNQTDLDQYYKTLQTTPENFYKGMFEAIGRTTIYAAQFMDNPFAKYMKDPVTQGNAVMSGYLVDIKSRNWNFKGAKTDQNGVPLEREPRYTAVTPELKTSVARMKFVREVAIRMDPQFYQQHCQTPEMVGDFAAALSAQSHARYMNDMYEACKMYFCGVIRVDSEPTDSVEDLGSGKAEQDLAACNVPPDAVNRKDSKMVACINYADKACQQDEFNKIVNNTIGVDFNFLSKKFNPDHRNTKSTNITLIMDKHFEYDMFKSKYSMTWHEDYIKPNVSKIWIDEFPKLATNPFNPDYTLVAMLVDDEALAIYPQGDGLSVHTEFNGQQESVNVFTHYKYIFEFKPFFNRKYIYLREHPEPPPGS